MDGTRLLVAGLVLVAVVVLTLWYRRRHEAASAPQVGSFPTLPDSLHQRGERTWVVFTTPYCASCEPVAQQLRVADPDGRVVKIDATEDTELAAGYEVRRAPTVVMADPDGSVGIRLVGGDAVRTFLDSLELDATL